MWPSEGSVCQQMIPLLARHGIQWIATDEEILGCSTHGKVGRDSRGHVRHPELLYRPWKVSEAGHELAIVFRDHSMSDQVGFHYQRSPGPVAAGDFLGKLHAIGDACRHNPATIVPVILDGENCWEYYPDGGVSFLRSLYQQAVRDPRIRAGDGRRVPPRPPAGRHPAPALRRKLDQPQLRDLDRPPRGQPRPGTPCTRPASSSSRPRDAADTIPTSLPAAWDELYIAEGSDWFWWYGDDHSSALDALFDHLFRKHLRNVYTLLGHDPPGVAVHADLAGGAAPADPRPAEQLPARQGRRLLDVLRVDQRRPVRLRQRARHDGAGDEGPAPVGLVRLQRREAPDPRRHRGSAGVGAAGRGGSACGSGLSTRPTGKSSCSEPVAGPARRR